MIFRRRTLNISGYLGETKIDEINRELTEDNIQRSQIHPQAVDIGSADGSSFWKLEPEGTGVDRLLAS